MAERIIQTGCLTTMDHRFYTKKYVQFIKGQLPQELENTLPVVMYNYLLKLTRGEQPDRKNRAMIFNLSFFFHEEYRLAKWIIENINEIFGTSFDDRYIADLALLIGEAEFRVPSDVLIQIVEQVNEMIKLVKYYFMFHLDYTTPAGHSFIEHLKYLSLRMQTGQKDTDSIADWADVAKGKYQLAYQCSENIAKYLKNMYRFELTETEILYLMIHIQTLVYSNHEKKQSVIDEV